MGRDLGDVVMRGHFCGFGGSFCLEVLLVQIPTVLGRFCNDRRTHVSDDYALISAKSGWTPMMFMTRVRL